MKTDSVTIDEATIFFAISNLDEFLTLSHLLENRPFQQAGCLATTFSSDQNSARTFQRRLTAANQLSSATSHIHSPGASNAALAAFRRLVDVAVLLGFRSTPPNGSRDSLLFPRMTARAMACMTPDPISATRENASAELALQRSTVQQSNWPASNRLTGAT